MMLVFERFLRKRRSGPKWMDCWAYDTELIKKNNSTYLIFQLTPIDFHDPVPDKREIDDARYFSLSEIEELSKDQMPELNRLVARRLLSGVSPALLSNLGDINYTDQPYNLYLPN